MLTKKVYLVIGTAFALSAGSQSVNAGKLYKWVDADGNISYQDQPPPDNVKVLEEREVKAPTTTAKSKKSSTKKPKVILYTVANCIVCDGLAVQLKKFGVPHIERSLQSDREAQSKILETTGSVVAPVVFIGEQILQSPNTNQLASNLKQAGYVIQETSSTK